MDRKLEQLIVSIVQFPQSQIAKFPNFSISIHVQIFIKVFRRYQLDWRCAIVDLLCGFSGRFTLHHFWQ